MAWANLVSAALVTPRNEGSAENEMNQHIIEVAQSLGLSAPSPNRRDQMRYVKA